MSLSKDSSVLWNHCFDPHRKKITFSLNKILCFQFMGWEVLIPSIFLWEISVNNTIHELITRLSFIYLAKIRKGWNPSEFLLGWGCQLWDAQWSLTGTAFEFLLFKKLPAPESKVGQRAAWWHRREVTSRPAGPFSGLAEWPQSAEEERELGGWWGTGKVFQRSCGCPKPGSLGAWEHPGVVEGGRVRIRWFLMSLPAHPVCEAEQRAGCALLSPLCPQRGAPTALRAVPKHWAPIWH